MTWEEDARPTVAIQPQLHPSFASHPPPGFTKIKSFQANGLPLVGDTAVRNVFESKLLFGYKRNMGCSELEEVAPSAPRAHVRNLPRCQLRRDKSSTTSASPQFECGGSDEVTELSASWLETACNNLMAVSFRSCVNIGTELSMSRLGALPHLTSLDVADCR